MPIIELPDGVELEFPDGMSEQEMASAIHKSFPEFAPKQSQSGGFIASAKQMVGSGIKGAGQAAADFIPGVDRDNVLVRYGQEVIDANPTAIHSLEDIADRPGMAVKEATGNAAASVGEMIGVRALGQGITAAAPLTGPAAPVVAGIGQVIAWLGPAAIAALPSYGGIRDKQILNDPGNQESGKAKAVAVLGAAAVGAIETKFGPQNWALAAMTKEGRTELAKKFASTTLTGSIGKGIVRGTIEEGGEELAQNPIEQLAAFDDPRKPENVKETLFGGAMGAIGGGVLGGGFGAIGERTAKPETQPADILNSSSTDEAINKFNDSVSESLTDQVLTQEVSTPVQRDIGALSQGATGFGKIDEFANLIEREQADIAQKRNELFQRQALKRESNLESVDNSVAGAWQAESSKSRLDLLDAAYSDSSISNPAEKFLADLGRQFPNNPIPTPEEKRIIASRESARKGFFNYTEPTEQPIPSAPNEMEGLVREKKQATQPTVAHNLVKVDEAIAAGYTLDKSRNAPVLKSSAGKPFLLSKSQYAHYKQRMEEQNAARNSVNEAQAVSTGMGNAGQDVEVPAQPAENVSKNTAPVAQTTGIVDEPLSQSAGTNNSIQTATGIDGREDVAGNELGNAATGMGGNTVPGVLATGEEGGRSEPAAIPEQSGVQQQSDLIRKHGGEIIKNYAGSGKQEYVKPMVFAKVLAAVRMAVKDDTGNAKEFRDYAKLFPNDSDLHYQLRSLADVIEPPKQKVKNIQPQGPMSAFQFIASEGGVNLQSASSQMGGLDDMKKRPNVFVKSGGMLLDGLGEKLATAGYLSVDKHGKYEPQDLEDLINDELSGNKRYTKAGLDELAKAEVEREQLNAIREEAKSKGIRTVARTRQQMLDDLAALENKNQEVRQELTREEWDAIDNLMIAVQSKSSEMDALASQIYQEESAKHAGNDLAFYEAVTKRFKDILDGQIQEGAGISEQAVTGKPGEGEGLRGEGDAGGATQEGIALESYTAKEVTDWEDARIKAESEAKKAQDEDERKAQSERERENIRQRSEGAAYTFQLGQSAEDNLSGQGDIFSKPAVKESLTGQIIPLSKVKNNTKIELDGKTYKAKKLLDAANKRVERFKALLECVR